MKCPVLLVAAATFFAITTSASAVGLTLADFEYLVAHDVAKTSPVIQGLSPKEQARLHALINDQRTENDPSARTEAINNALTEFRSNQRWEEMHPGRLWDAPKGGRSN